MTTAHRPYHISRHQHMLYLNVVEAFDKVYESIAKENDFELNTEIQDKIESLAVMITIQILEKDQRIEKDLRQ